MVGKSARRLTEYNPRHPQNQQRLKYTLNSCLSFFEALIAMIKIVLSGNKLKVAFVTTKSIKTEALRMRLKNISYPRYMKRSGFFKWNREKRRRKAGLLKIFKKKRLDFTKDLFILIALRGKAVIFVGNKVT